MALQVIATDQGGGPASALSATTAGVSVPAGALVVVGVAFSGSSSGSISSVVGAPGDVFNQVTASNATGGIVGPATILYYAKNSVGKSLYQVTVKLSSSFGGTIGIFVWVITGASLIGPLDAANGGIGTNGSSGGATNAFTTTFANEIICYIVGNTTVPTTDYAATGGFSTDSAGFGVSGSQFGGAQHEIVSSTQSGITPRMTGIPGTTTHWAASAAGFRDQSFDVATISGNVGKASVTVNYSGPSSGSVTSGSNGNYSITGLGDGTYTITPSLAGFAFVPISQTVVLQGVTVTNVNFTTPYSVPDCRNYGSFPNQSRDVQGTLIYDVQTSSNHSIPPTDSRVAGAPVDCRKSPNIPQNSRKAGTFGPGE